MRRMALLLFAAFFAPLHWIVAQRPGESVRLTTRLASSRRLIGTLVGEDAESFSVQLAGDAAPVSVARSAVIRLEISRGQKRWLGEGAGTGAGLGAIAGFVLSGVRASYAQSCSIRDIYGSCYVEWYGRAFRGALIGSTIGAAVGAALGYAVRTERWERVPLGGAHHLSLVPRDAGLALSLAF